jgi:hypothetical protein
MWRGQVSQEEAGTTLQRLEGVPIKARTQRRLVKPGASPMSSGGPRPTVPEYVALGSLLACQLVTVDTRLWRATRELRFVVSPSELTGLL